MKVYQIFIKLSRLLMIFFLMQTSVKAGEKKGKITQGLFIENDCLFYKYSAIIDEINGKRIEIPIFGGTLTPESYANLKKAMGDDNRSLTCPCFKPKKGESKKMFLDILNFYKKSLFRNIDIEHPTVIGGEEGSWIIWYDFVYQGVIGSVMFHISAGNKLISDNPKSIHEIDISEKGESLEMSIDIGAHSPFYKKK